jgi:hypothetical protein
MSPPAYAADKATRDAQARFVEGLARVKAGDFEAARLSFAQAYVVLRKPDILWNLALSEEKSGHVVDALVHFKELGRTTPPGDDRTQAKKHIDSLMGQTGHIEVVAPSGTRLFVDGTDAGVTPLADAVDVMPGKHHVVAGEKSTDADVSAGEVAHVNFVVIPEVPEVLAPPAPPAPSAPPAEVPAPLLPPPFEAPATPQKGFDGTARTVTVIGVGAAALGGAVLGVTFGLQAQSDANTAAQLRGSDTGACLGAGSSQCSQLKAAVDAQNRDETISLASYVSSAVLASAAVAVWLLWPTTGASASKPAVVPALAPAGWGPGLQGTF